MRTPLLIAIKQVRDSSKVDNITHDIIDDIMDNGGLHSIAVRSKLISFGADGVSLFRGCKTGMGVQLKQRHAPFYITVHDFAHKLNLAFKALAGMGVMPSVEALLSDSYNYFVHSPKKILESKIWQTRWTRED